MSTRQDLLRRDAEARRQAQTEFDVPILLEAGAGTGKTSTLVARILSWSLGRGWAQVASEENEDRDAIAARVVSGVVAITFTEAASAEMGARVGVALARLERGEVVEGFARAEMDVAQGELAQRAAALLGVLDRLKVRTIHAFCRWLLNRFPVEVGLDPDFRIDPEEAELERIVREVVETRVHDAFSEPADPHLVALAAAGHGPPQLALALQALAREAVPSSALDSDPFGGEAWGQLVQRVADALRQLADLIVPRMAGGRYNGTKIAAALPPLMANLKRRPPATRDELWTMLDEALPENLRKHLGDWRRGLKSKDDTAKLGEVADEVSACSAVVFRLLRHVESLDPTLLEHARRALAPMLAEVHDSLREEGVANYESLLHDARTLLTEHPGVLRRIRREIDQLLVDEFQDTSRVQCELVDLLALQGPEDDRPGLFLVGDPKQSIYGWRDADLRAYDAFARRIETVRGQRHTLAVNFRSAPAVLDEVQHLVDPVMHERVGVQPRFEPLISSDANVAGKAGDHVAAARRVEHWVAWPVDPEDKLSAREASALEARALAADIAATHTAMQDQREGGYAWSNFAVLLRSTTDLDVYLEAFRRAAVPYAVERDRNYFRRREIIDASAAMRAILDPGDHLALVTMLRAPFVGVPDAAWLPLWKRQFPEKVTLLSGEDDGAVDELEAIAEAAARELPSVPGAERIAGWEQSLKAALRALAALRRSFRQDPHDVFLTRMRQLLPMEIVAAARFLGEYRLANLDRFFRDMHLAMDEEGGDVQAILRRLRHSVTEMLEAEEARPQEAGRNAVQVMTIHVAKGLGFDHVYVMQTQKTGRPPAFQRTEVHRTEAGVEYVLFGSPSPGYDLVQESMDQVESAERIRMLYVAATRAKERLVVSGSWPPRAAFLGPDRARSLQDLIRHRHPTPPDFTTLMASARSSSNDGVEAEGARWVFLGLRPQAEAQPTTAHAPRPGLELSIEQDRGKAAQAHKRSERPFQLAASEAARLQDQWPAWEEETTGPATAGAGRPGAGLLVGSWIHRLLETLDFDQDLDPQLAAARERAGLELAGVEGAVERADGLVEGLARGTLRQRLTEVAPHVVARELPVLLPATESSGAAGSVVGSIDLLHRDPSTGRLVIVDYKTDRVASPAMLDQRIVKHAGQGRIYARAVREALQLDYEPALELWFLDADHREIVRPAD